MADATRYRAELKNIRTFPSLVKFLRDEMGWPIATDSFEDLTFDYTPEELGIDAKNAAKIQEIKRLRPLVPKQPWGIFFVKFEPKRLPVVALRRILGQVALRKRASANRSERQAWAADDLLFVSNYGEGDERRIAFAHFAKSEDGADLPTLKVLGWDNLDTPLHLDDVAEKLARDLAWPDDPANEVAWRARWNRAFTLRHREVITTSKELSVRLAELARAIRDRIKTALAIETERGPLTKLMKAFQAALVHDLDADGFADMYAQTIAYGLLSARIADPHRKTSDDFAAHMRTNPFLRELMETFLKVGGRRGKAGGVGIDFDELGVSEVIQLLDDANMEAVVGDFGDLNPQEDPVIHFYELFLKEYDAKKRMQRGVFYTPRPVVSYIVRSVDQLLRREFGLPDGLADITSWRGMADRHENLSIPDGVSPDHAFVQILDPATGTGTFLVEVIDLVYKTLVAKWKEQGHDQKRIDRLWNEYVPKHLLTRLHGYELLMAPYAIAHLKIGLKLYETGYRFASDERARVYLTNALEPPGDLQLAFDFLPALAHEAEAVNDIKRSQRFTVIVGNPPYSDASQNLGAQFEPLIRHFRFYEGQRIRERGAIRFEHVINNDYVKFWGLGLNLLATVPVGTICLITSNSYLGGKSFRGVRDSMRRSCESIWVTDLHGEGWSGQLARRGVTDENMFEIQTGVAVALFLKRTSQPSAATVRYGELIGTYDTKVRELTTFPATLQFIEVPEDPPSYRSFVPQKSVSHTEYWNFPQLNDLFYISVDGIKTSRDGLVIANSQSEVIDKLQSFGESRESNSELEERFCFESNRLDLKEARKHVAKTFSRARIKQIAYRPYDIRFIYYDEELILSHRIGTMPRILYPGAEAVVCASRLSAPGFEHAVAARTLCTNKYSSHDINSRMFFVVYGDSGLVGDQLVGGIRTEYLDAAGIPAHLPSADRARVFGWYVLGILNAPSYQKRYAEEIQQDFPRVPLPREDTLLKAISSVGTGIADAHCLALRVPDDRFVFHGQIGDPCSTPELKDTQLWVGPNSYIEGVRRDVWEYRLAGYKVCGSWFTAGGRSCLARKNASLTKDVVHRLRVVLFSVEETIRLQGLLDEAIEANGGWPAAFAVERDRPVRRVAEPKKHPYGDPE